MPWWDSSLPQAFVIIFIWYSLIIRVALRFNIHHNWYRKISEVYFLSSRNIISWAWTSQIIQWIYGCFLKWWYPQNTPKWSFLVGKPMVLWYHHFRKPPNMVTLKYPRFNRQNLPIAKPCNLERIWGLHERRMKPRRQAVTQSRILRVPSMGLFFFVPLVMGFKLPWLKPKCVVKLRFLYGYPY